MKTDSLYKNPRAMVVVFLTLSTLIACQSSPFSYKGKEVAEDSRIYLKEGGPHKGIWQTNDFTFDYTYTRKGGKLKIDGKLELDDYFQGMEVMDFIFFNVNYIDAEGKLQDSKTLWSATNRSWDFEWVIRREIDMPDYMEWIGFSYSGTLREFGGGGVQLDLWVSPLDKKSGPSFTGKG
jgi:hypothetical protein